MVGGAGLLVAFVPVGYHMAQYLIAGFWRQSPWERGILPPFQDALAMAQPNPEPVQQVVIREPMPWRANGQERALQPPGSQPPPVVSEPGPDDTTSPHSITRDTTPRGPTIEPDPKTANLIWFALYAIRLPGLSRSQVLTIAPAPMLPYKEPDARGVMRDRRLRKATYLELLARGERWGWWRRRGSGAPPEFVKPRLRIEQEALQLWTDMGMIEPVPNYWAEAESTKEEAA